MTDNGSLNLVSAQVKLMNVQLVPREYTVPRPSHSDGKMMKFTVHKLQLPECLTHNSINASEDL